MLIALCSNCGDLESLQVVLFLKENKIDFTLETSSDFITIQCEQLSKTFCEQITHFPYVVKIIDQEDGYPLSSRSTENNNLLVHLSNTVIGGPALTFMAGPCGVESEEQIFTAAAQVKNAGATILRGGAFKPRTSPYAFQGMGEEGLKLLASAGKAVGLPIITEVLNQRAVEMVAEYADILQIGMRNMYNYELLKEVGAAGRPVMLKRNHAATLQEWILAAEYLANAGCRNIIMCERGIRTFSTDTRFTLDISSIPLVKLKTRYPVIVDVSHAAGCRELIIPLAKAGIAAGADGIMVEVHPYPEQAKSDGSQALDEIIFSQCVKACQKIK